MVLHLPTLIVMIILPVVGPRVMIVGTVLLKCLVEIWVVLHHRLSEAAAMGMPLLNLHQILSNAMKHVGILVTILEFTSQICLWM